MTSNGSTNGTVEDMTDPGMHELTIDDPAISRRSVKVRNMVDRLRDVRVPLRGTRVNASRRASSDVGVDAADDVVDVADEMLIGEPYEGSTTARSMPVAAHHVAAFDLRSVFSMATRFYACTLAMVLAATILFWILGSIVGLVGAFEKLMRGIGFSGFQFLSIELLFGVTFLAAVIGAFLVGMTVVAAALYNVLAQRHGGVRVLIAPAPAGAGAVIDDELHINGNGSNGNGSNGNSANGNGAKHSRPPSMRRAATRPMRNRPKRVVPPISA